MATLAFSALGTAIGGPIGGGIGALVGQQVDRSILAGPGREGPRLDDLRVSTSSYGSPIARNCGRLRAAGTIIWATDLVESAETSGGKAGPSVTSYNYSVSLAVALSSRPLVALGRIWADGNLLRGEDGALKTGGTMRFYSGYGDQGVDPLIASAEGAACPAFRGTAYVVFEDLQLGMFGNRIPALSFELMADSGEITLAELLGPDRRPIGGAIALPGLKGFANEGGPMAATLATIGSLYPLACAAGGEELRIIPAGLVPGEVPLLPEPVAAANGDSFGEANGIRRQRDAGSSSRPDALRYYDIDRDYLAGLQRAGGQAMPGRTRTIEFPGSLAADIARSLVDRAAERAAARREAISWRIAELDPALGPGSIVRLPGHAGHWRIDGWEWREYGVELELGRLPRGSGRELAGDSGTYRAPADLAPAPTVLRAFELPWDGSGDGGRPVIMAAPSAASAGWSGAALYAGRDGQLVPLGASGTRRSIIGQLQGPLEPSPAILLESMASFEVQLLAPELGLADADIAMLAGGANRALVGSEILQFARAEPLGGGRWRLSGLLRGRGGSEAAARLGHGAGTLFALLDHRPVRLDSGAIGTGAATAIAALGIGDNAPVIAAIANEGATLRPLSLVHPRAALRADGSLHLAWVRRARGAWQWADEVETPLGEQAEAYLVGVGEIDAPALLWQTAAPSLVLEPGTLATLESAHAGAPVWVRQVGTYALSPPLLLHTLP